MPNIASLLKAEIVRLARKEVRNEVGSMRKSSATHRREIAATVPPSLPQPRRWGFSCAA